MPSSFRYLLAVTGLVALLFAAISAWPLFSNWMRSRNAPQTATVPVVATPAPQQATPAIPTPRRSPQTSNQARPLPSVQPPAQSSQQGSGLPANARNVRRVASQGYVPGGWTTGDGEDSLGWCYARETTMLLNKPEGDPLVPVNLNRCPLTIGKGTRLGMIRQEGSWLLVHSTFSTTGWVHEQSVTDVKMDEQTLQ
ncbi:hypothetical protein KDL29_04780 [bacterium]|nr:hypothetical protein [bacterium]